MEVGDYISASQKKRKQRRKYIVIALSVIAACFVVFGSYWIVFKSPVFRIKNIDVRGNTTVASDTIIALVRSSAFSKNNFTALLLGTGNMLAWPDAIPANVIASVPSLVGVDIKKDYMARTITITVAERKPFAVWCFMPKGSAADANTGGTATGTMVMAMETNEQCSWFDESGIMFEDGFDSEGSVVMAVHDYSQSSAPLGAAILPARFVPNLISIIKVLRASGLNVKEVRLNDIGLEEIQATTYDGPDIYFSLRFPADDDLPVIQSLMADPGFKNLQYLDFRTEDRAYYK